MKKIIGIGAGSHGKVVLEVIQAMGGYEPVGFLDPCPDLKGTFVAGLPVIGDDNLSEGLAKEVQCVFIGFGGLGNWKKRAGLFERFKKHGKSIVSAIHPSAHVSGTARLGEGVTIMPGAIVNAGAELGSNAIVNSGAIVEHDCVIKNHAHIAPGAKLAGGVLVGEGTHVGLGACVREGIHVGDNVMVGAGAAVVKNVPNDVVVVGVPAEELKPKRIGD